MLTFTCVEIFYDKMADIFKQKCLVCDVQFQINGEVKWAISYDARKIWLKI